MIAYIRLLTDRLAHRVDQPDDLNWYNEKADEIIGLINEIDDPDPDEDEPDPTEYDDHIRAAIDQYATALYSIKDELAGGAYFHGENTDETMVSQKELASLKASIMWPHDTQKINPNDLGRIGDSLRQAKTPDELYVAYYDAFDTVRRLAMAERRRPLPLYKLTKELQEYQMLASDTRSLIRRKKTPADDQELANRLRKLTVATHRLANQLQSL